MRMSSRLSNSVEGLLINVRSLLNWSELNTVLLNGLTAYDKLYHIHNNLAIHYALICMLEVNNSGILFHSYQWYSQYGPI